ncbi:alpha/beta hydrolase [Aquimarina celericrescens]|uniref:Alpha/beta hydrolase n=1 Tax=Aquimarina celericrescens TaxID=1964542 RepID=A0ABW5AZL1_9FLAO
MNLMRINFTMVLTIIFIVTSYAQNRAVIDIWPDKVPGEPDPKHPAEVDKSIKDTTTIHLTNVTNPNITVFQPKPFKNNGIGIIIAPGGGYYILAIDKEGYEVAEWLTSLGYTAFVLQYRVPKKEQGALQDIQRAIRIVRSKASDFNININTIGVLGFSAGGSLSARLSTLSNKNTYDTIDIIDKMNGSPDFSILIYPAYLDLGPSQSLTPDIKINNNTPPTFIFATADDKHANSALVMTSALRNKDLPVEFHLLPKGGHGYGLRKGNVAAETWPKLLEMWLETHILQKN